MPLFQGILYHLSESLAEHPRLEIARILDANGATQVDLDLATHIISNTVEFQGCDALRKGVACVTVSMAITGGKCADNVDSLIGRSAAWSLAIYRSRSLSVLVVLLSCSLTTATKSQVLFSRQNPALLRCRRDVSRCRAGLHIRYVS